MKKRISPARRDQWSESVHDILGASRPAADAEDGEGPPNILYTIAHHPTLLAPLLAMSSAIALQGVLPRRDSELLALRASLNCRSPFEWGHHVEYGLAEGLSESDIEQIAEGPDHVAWSERDRLLLRAADQLHARQDLEEDTFRALERELEPAQIVELCFVIGQYTMLSMVANATGVPLEARLRALPSPRKSPR